MKIIILSIGKTNEKYLQEGIDLYLNRLKHYTSIEYKELKDVKPNSDPKVLMLEEAKQFLTHINQDDFVVILDEHGEQMTSIALSKYFIKLQNLSTKKMVFIIGGAYGIEPSLKARANHILSFSNFTFSHQMIRLFLTEQVYRAFTIIRGEKYHNA